MKLKYKIPLVIFFILVVFGILGHVLATITKGENNWIGYLIGGIIAVVGISSYLIGERRDWKARQIPQNNNESQPTG